MSRMTCLIIFSGSSARSIISLRLARIRVLTRSKSPMVMLLPKRFDTTKKTDSSGVITLRVHGLKRRKTMPQRVGDLGPGNIHQDQRGEDAECPEECSLSLYGNSHDVLPPNRLFVDHLGRRSQQTGPV